MKFYYTTTAGENLEQRKKEVSLGGYKSSTLVPNNYLNNIFGDISLLTIQRNQEMYIALVLVNETGGDITNLNAWFVYPTDDENNNISDTKIEIAAVLMSQDDEGVDIMENVENMYSAPYSANFFEADSEDNKVTLISSFTNGDKIGIWLKRSLLIDKIKSDYNSMVVKDQDNSDIYKEVSLPTEDNIGLVLEWD